MSESRNLRLFLAIELPAEWQGSLSRLRGRLEGAAGNSVKWVRPDLMHITLVFLGNLPSGRVAEVGEAMEAAAAGVRPFGLALGPPGYFGAPHRLRTLWVGLRDTPPGLLKLHADLVRELSRRSVPFDAKGLVPHVTLGRARARMDTATSLKLHAAVEALGAPQGGEMLVEEFVLMESRLHPAGPEYLPVRTARLGGRDV